MRGFPDCHLRLLNYFGVACRHAANRRPRTRSQRPKQASVVDMRRVVLVGWSGSAARISAREIFPAPGASKPEWRLKGSIERTDPDRHDPGSDRRVGRVGRNCQACRRRKRAPVKKAEKSEKAKKSERAKRAEKGRPWRFFPACRSMIDLPEGSMGSQEPFSDGGNQSRPETHAALPLRV